MFIVLRQDQNLDFDGNIFIAQTQMIFWAGSREQHVND